MTNIILTCFKIYGFALNIENVDYIIYAAGGLVLRMLLAVNLGVLFIRNINERSHKSKFVKL